jgi:hypothetical protein
MKKNIIVIDDFYINVDEVRQFALTVEYQPNLKFYKGLRSVKNYQQDGIKEVFESLIGENITSFPNEGSNNGCFQITIAEDPQVYHHDTQKWAAMIYLTPNAPLDSGTRTHQSKINGAKHMSDANILDAFTGGHYDSTKFNTVDTISNVYNRLVIMDAQNIHSAGNYFGNSKETGRLIQLFFFD